MCDETKHYVKLMKYFVISVIYIQVLYISDYGAIVNAQTIAVDACIDYTYLGYSNGKATLSITNNCKDTIFLFSSYLDIKRSKLRYLYRINNEYDTVKISFLPILPFLFCHTAFLRRPEIYENPERQKETIGIMALYLFIAIAPEHTENIVIHTQDIYNKTSYIREDEFNLSTMHINSEITLPQPIEVEPDEKRNFVFEFALYLNIKDITIDSYINTPYSFNKAAKDYIVLKLLYAPPLQ